MFDLVVVHPELVLRRLRRVYSFIGGGLRSKARRGLRPRGPREATKTGQQQGEPWRQGFSLAEPCRSLRGMHDILEANRWETQGDEATLGELVESWARGLPAGSVILLHGMMGAGKTTLTRAIARGIGVYKAQRVCSPTYQVAMEHPGPIPLIHVDLFRVGESDLGMGPAMEALGLDEDERCGREGVWVVEWGGYWKDPPAERYELHLECLADPSLGRRLSFCASGPKCAKRLASWAQEQSLTQFPHAKKLTSLEDVQG